MKEKKQLWRKYHFGKAVCVLASALALAFALAACSGDSGGGESSGPTALGTGPLVMEGQVYRREITLNKEENITGEKIAAGKDNSNNMEISTSSGYIGGSGKITNGLFDFSVDTEIENYLVPFEDYLSNLTKIGYTITSTEPAGTNVRYARLNKLEAVIDSDNVSLRRERESKSGSETSGTSVSESISYIYVDSDISFAARGYVDEPAGYTDEGGITYTEKETIKDLNISFKKGWNVLYSKSTWVRNTTASTITYNGTREQSSANPSNVNWIYNVYIGK